MKTSENLDKLSAAMVQAQTDMPGTKDDAKGYNYTYTTLDQIINKARPSLVANGLVIVQAPISEDGRIGLTTRLMHESGQWLESTIFAPANADKQSQPIKVAGSIITYLRRYAYTSFTGIAAEDDTDGVPQKPRKPSKNTTPPAPDPVPVKAKIVPAPEITDKPLFNGNVADARAWLEEKGTCTLGIVADALVMTGIYNDRKHVGNALNGADGQALRDKGLKVDMRMKVKGTLFIFDWAVERKRTEANDD